MFAILEIIEHIVGAIWRRIAFAGRILDAIWRLVEKKMPWRTDHEAIVWLMVLLIIAGLLNVFSSTFVLAENEGGMPYTYVIKQLISCVIGTGIFLVAWYIDYHKWRQGIGPLWIILMILLIAVFIIGPEINGSKRWIYLGPFSLQPAEFAKICCIMMASYTLASVVEGRWKLFSSMVFVRFLAIAVAGLLVYKEPDMGTACVVFGIPVVMLWLAGLSVRGLAGVGVIGVIGFAIAVIMQPYRLQRILVTYDPWSDAQNMGYQTVQSITAVGSGGIWGMGLGQGLAKYAYLPEAHTDFAFAVFAQENGLLWVLFILLLFFLFAYYANRICQSACDSYGRLLASGIMLLVTGQAAVNLLMATGLLPVVGVPLPFISYGGSSLLVTMFATGLLVNIGRYSHNKRQRELRKKMAAAPVQAPAPQAKIRPTLRRIK